MEARFDLTFEQKLIIKSKSDVKKVIACAGSGKTSVLTQNVIEILRKKTACPEEILALTFTNNAAENMREKISKNLAFIDLNNLDIYTFNSFGNFLIMENSFMIGFGKNFKLINEVQSWQIIYEIFKQYNFNSLKAGKDQGRFVKDILDYIWNLKNNLVTINELKNYVQSYKDYIKDFKSAGLAREEEEKIPYMAEFCDIYEKYEAIKKRDNFIDYADQIFLPYFLFKQRPAVREKYSHKYKYIFIDEFQDTNNAQAYLLSMLYMKGKNKLMIVGDDDQGIYGFRGACIENIQDFSYFEDDMEKLVKTFFLTVNFRSGREIINFTNSIIKDNRKREVKVVKPENEEKRSHIIFFKKNSLEEEARQISEMISNLVRYGYKLKDIAVLCRRKRFKEIIKSFIKNDIRFEIIGSRSYFYEPEILFLLSWLKLIQNINDDEAAVFLLKSSKYKISDRDIYFLRKNDTLIGAVRNADSNNYLGEETKKRLALFLLELDYYIKNSQLLSLNEIISMIFHSSGLYDELNSRFGIISKKKIINIENLIKLAWEFEENNFNADFESFVIYLKDISKTEYEDPDFQVVSSENSVKLMSIHAAKGLEFKVVFLPMLWEQDYKVKRDQKKFMELPSSLRKDGKIWKEKGNYTTVKEFESDLKSMMLEEEKRIFYVASSRPQELLILSYPRYENFTDILKENIKIKNINPFIENIFNENSSTIFFGDETFDYLNSTFNIKPQFYFNSFEEILERFKEGQNHKKNQKNKSSYEDSENSAKKINFRENIFLDKYEKYIAENINNIKENLSDLFSNKLENLITGNIAENIYNVNMKDSYSLTEVLTFLECPFLYKFRYKINLPEAASKTTDYGIKMHKFIENVTAFSFKNFLNNKNSSNKKETQKDTQFYLQFFNIKNIEDLKYKEYLNNFFKSSLINFKLEAEVLLEQLFYWKINKYYLTCKIDRLDIHSNGLIILYDYKTSSYEKHSLNSSYIYQVKSYICMLSDLFDISIEKISGNLFFLGDGTILPVKVENWEKQQIKNSLNKTIYDIKNNKYPENYPKKCTSHCNFKSICPVNEK
ncbi:MAG: ATP-dependent helicase [Actinobacteria bacterium]|nr:ATP-dependent helicase [Actinomycetota bacterium]